MGEPSSLREGMGMGLSCEGMGLGCEAFGLLFFFAQSYKINQRAPNIRAKKQKKVMKAVFAVGITH